MQKAGYCSAARGAARGNATDDAIGF